MFAVHYTLLVKDRQKNFTLVFYKLLKCQPCPRIINYGIINRLIINPVDFHLTRQVYTRITTGGLKRVAYVV